MKGYRLGLTLLLMLLAAASAAAQTSAELRKKYGEPEILRFNDGRPNAERYKLRSDILLTVTYTNKGEPCELKVEPVPSKTSRTDYVGDLMPTTLAVELVNELVPVSVRGNLVSSLHVNGGDPKMKLHHPGCTGIDYVRYEHVVIDYVTWCQGGTFSASIHRGELDCKGQTLTTKRKR